MATSPIASLTPAQKQAWLADYEASVRYGVNPTALIASQTNESSWLPNRVEGSTFANPTVPTAGSTSNASGLAQFLPSTWVADYKELFGVAPSSPNAGAYPAIVQADVEANALKQSNIGMQKDTQAALTDIVNNFEQPGAAGAAQDIAAGQQTISYYGLGGGVFGPGSPGIPPIVNMLGLGGNPVSAAIQQANSATNKAVDTATNAIGTGIGAFTRAGSFFSWITNTKNMIRVGEMIGGGIFIFIGVIMVGRAATSSSAASQVSGAARTAAAPVRQVRSGRRRPAPPRAAPARRQGFAAAPTDRELRRAELRKRKRMGRMEPGEEIPF